MALLPGGDGITGIEGSSVAGKMWLHGYVWRSRSALTAFAGSRRNRDAMVFLSTSSPSILITYSNVLVASCRTMSAIVAVTHLRTSLKYRTVSSVLYVGSVICCIDSWNQINHIRINHTAPTLTLAPKMFNGLNGPKSATFKGFASSSCCRRRQNISLIM